MGTWRVVAAGIALCCLEMVGATSSLAGTGGGLPPQAVSPGSPSGGLEEALVEARCPTFSWAGFEGADGYELVVLVVDDGGIETAGGSPLVSRVHLSSGARSWTPSLGSCLERGGRYAWSVRAVIGGADGRWSEPALFRVAAGPSHQEVEAAMETLRRHLEGSQSDGGSPEPAAEALAQSLSPPGEGLLEELATARERRAAGGEGPPARTGRWAESGLAPLELQGADDPPHLAFTSAPVLGSPSLSVSANVALGAGSNLFKDGATFLWDDSTGNTALGRHALTFVTPNSTSNTAVGHRALLYTTGSSAGQGSHNTGIGARALYSNTTGRLNTATGAHALIANTTGHRNTAHGFNALGLNDTGYRNTASGYLALASNTTGYRNTATGELALLSNTTGHRNTASGSLALRTNITGHRNTASGVEALHSNTTGHRNTASGALALRSNFSGTHNTAAGYAALFNNTAGQRNVAIGNLAGFQVTGAANRDDNIFISNQGVATDNKKIRIGTQGTQDGTFIAGIHGVGVSGSTVLVSSAGQLGVSSSSARFKEGVEQLGEIGERLAALRPVTFRYRPEVLPDAGPQVGLVAEEVAELFPELVARDAEGRPFGVRYDLLSVLSLAELQQQVAINRAQDVELAALRKRVAVLEGEERQPEQRRTPWRRRTDS